MPTDTLDGLRPLFRQALADLPASLQDDVIAELRPHLDVTTPPVRDARHRRVDAGIGEVDTWYAVHDDDLKLVEECGKAALAFHAKPVTALPSLVALLLRYRTKRIALSGDPAHVLLTLKKVPLTGASTASSFTWRWVAHVWENKLRSNWATYVTLDTRGILLGEEEHCTPSGEREPDPRGFVGGTGPAADLTTASRTCGRSSAGASGDRRTSPPRCSHAALSMIRLW